MRAIFCCVFFASFLSVAALADGCVDVNGRDISSSPEAFQALISQQTSCDSAANLAQACAWGTSMDVRTAGAAIDVCKTQLDTENPTPANLALLKNMQDLCESKYGNMQGTLYRSMNSYCQLSAIRWIEEIVAPAEEN